jgi:GTP-binding protein EngB required for normal cell division
VSEAGLALTRAVADALPTLEALLAHREPLGDQTAAEIESALAAIRGRLGREELAVVVVGEKKAGKSTFLNAVLGERLLGAAMRECTGTVTLVRHGAIADYAARFKDGHVERFSDTVLGAPEVAATHPEARHHQFVRDLHELTDMAQRGAQVVELTLTYPAMHLPKGLLIVDTPGANTDHAENQARAWQAVRELADGCVLLSDLQQVMSRSTRDFLQELRQVVPHVVLVLTKADKALENAMDGAESAEEQLEEARRIGVRRFATEMGRDPSEVLSLAVAAEPVLRASSPEAPEVGRFHAELDRLFRLIQEERALMLGARAAGTLAGCVRRIAEAQARAEATYAERVARMEAQRIQAPAEFKRQHVAKARPVAMERAVTLVEEAAHGFRLALARVETRWSLKIASAVSLEELKARLPEWTAEHGREVDALARDAQAGLEQRLGAALQTLVLNAHDELRERYRLAQGGTMTAAPLPLELLLPVAGDFGVGLRSGLAGTVEAFESDVAKLRAGGAAAGAVIGSMIAPGLGTALGAALGSMAGRLFGLDMLKEDCQAQIQSGLAEADRTVTARLREARTAYEAALLRRFEEALGAALERFHQAIADLQAAEARRLDAARADLSSLVALGGALRAHEAAIARLSAEAVRHSAGLAAPA